MSEDTGAPNAALQTVDRVTWFCKCGLRWRFSGTVDGYDLLHKAVSKHLDQAGHRLLMHPVKAKVSA